MTNSSDHPRTRRTTRPRPGALTLIGTLTVGLVCSFWAAPVSAATVYFDGASGAARIGVIGDSSVAGIRWTNALSSLQSVNFTFDAESCRRTTADSCRGREGYAPENAITIMRRLAGQWGSVLVMGTGYNDPGTTFGSSVDAIMAEAAAQGIPYVMWMTMRSADVSYVAPTYNSNTYTFRDNNRILLQKSQQYGGRLQVADWATYSAGQAGWFASDGIHYTTTGAVAAAQFIVSRASAVLGGQTITPPPTANPEPGGWVTVRRGDRGPLVATVQRALARLGISVVGGADGVFGAYTEGAVRQFQSSRGLPATGVADAPTAAAMGLISADGIAAPPPPAPAAWTDLRMGSRGATVAAAQRVVINSGIFLRGGADGIYGAYTTAAVRQYQANRGLPQTGVVDASTATAMGLFTSSGTPTPIPPGSSGPARTYTVVRGDSLYGIARKSGVTIGDLLVLNNLALNSVIHPGMVLTVAAGSSGAAPAAPAAWTDVVIGARGSSVAAAQRAIINSGIYLRGGADGIFGPYTQAALRQYQLNAGLPQTGVVDTATAQAMGLYTPPAPATTTTTAVVAVAAAAPPTTTTTTTAAPAVAAVAAETLTATSAPATEDSSELTQSSIGDLVWLDADGDGQQDVDEVGVPDVEVRLLGLGETLLATTTTNHLGEFSFAGLPGAAYAIRIVVPEGFDVTTSDAVADDAVDSDAVLDAEVDQPERTASVAGVIVDGTDENIDTDIGLLATVVEASPSSEPVESAEADTTPSTSSTAWCRPPSLLQWPPSHHRSQRPVPRPSPARRNPWNLPLSEVWRSTRVDGQTSDDGAAGIRRHADSNLTLT